MSDLQPNDPRLRPLRGKDPLQGWLGTFARRDPERSKRYLDALHLFLGYPRAGAPAADWASRYVAARSPATLRAYRAAVAEFFEFLRIWHDGKLVAPHEVVRQDAFDYAEWLANRGRGDYAFSVDEEKLRDGDRTDDLAIFESVQSRGRAKLSEVARDLPRGVKSAHHPEPGQQTTQLVDETWLHSRLTALVYERLLVRSPRWVELRRTHKNIDFAEDLSRDTYTYFRPELRPVARSTIALRLSALSSFWQVLQRGENEGPKALLDYNVFEEALERVQRGVATEKHAASLEKRPTAELIGRLLEQAEKDSSALTGKRNVALFWFLLVLGTRITETLRLRRAEPSARDKNIYPGWLDLESKPPSVVLVRKGGKKQRLPVPSYPLAALRAFWAALAERAPAGMSPSDPQYRYRLLATERDAPLFPPLHLWGRNRPDEQSTDGAWAYRKPMGQSAVAMLFCRISHDAGFSDKERGRIHAHGFRHAAAQSMVDMGKPIREVQNILGHASIRTTEGYLSDELDLSRLDGQAEVLEWLSKKGVRAPGPPGPLEPRAPGPPPIVTTYGEDVAPKAAPRVVTPASRQLPSHEVPVGPEPPAKPFVVYQQPDEITLVRLGPDETPGSPVEPYEYLFRGKKPADLVWSSRPQASFIAKSYPKLPPRFGIGEASQLLWWNPDAPVPWPVLAPGQAYPEVVETGGLLAKLEHLYDEWLGTEPTRTAALAKWLLYLGMVTVGLERRLNGAYLWVPYESVGRVGRDLRAHDDDWLYRWFRENAHTFTVAARRFMGVRMPTAGEERDEYWESLRERLEVLGSVPAAVPPVLPEWFFEADPVHTLYTREASEWRAFRRWLGRLTGTDRERGARDEHRQEQTEFFEEGAEARRERLRGTIEQFYALVDETRAETRDRSKEESRQLLDQMRELRTHVKARYGLELPSEAPKERNRRRARIDEMVDRVVPRASAAAQTNVLGDSRLFDPQAFRINDTARTLEHTNAFREEFARENYGQDSECVMRRIARALWEQVRDVEYGHQREKDPRDVTRYLFVTQLAHLAYVVPCPPELEKHLAAQAGRGREKRRVSSPTELREVLRRAVEEALGGKAPASAADDTANALLDVFFEMDPDHDPRLGRSVAPPEAPENGDDEDERRGVAYRKNPGNSRELLPHPMRLVAATFWPV